MPAACHALHLSSGVRAADLAFSKRVLWTALFRFTEQFSDFFSGCTGNPEPGESVRGRAGGLKLSGKRDAALLRPPVGRRTRPAPLFRAADATKDSVFAPGVKAGIE